LYSVPWKHIGAHVWLKVSAHTVTVFADDQRVATHSRRDKGHRSTVEAHLPEHRAPLRHRSHDYWQARADELGEEVGRYVRAIFDSDQTLSQLRVVQAVVTHLGTFPVERARAACRRAEHFGSYSYRSLKNILRDGLDREPLPQSATSPSLPAPRFARPAAHWRH
jgi:hypothetical protein